MLALALLAAAATPSLPSSVVVPTPTESLGIDELYAVRDGALYVKRGSSPWARFDGAPPDVVAVFSDEVDHLMVVTADGRLHHHENGAWDSLWGLPSLPFVRGPLSLPVPLSSLRPGRVAYSMRRDHVLFYEDKNRAQFHWGDAGTTSVWVLSLDGRRLLFGDPWLPPDFSRELLAPEDGGLVMASVAASASTIFVAGVDGSLYTRFDDYDHDGGTPLFSYQYRAALSAKPPPAGRPGTDPLSAAQTRGLPGDDWHRQPDIPLVGKARLSRDLAVLQTGRGNAARELRVAGDDARGRRGYFKKPLDAPTWSFVAAPGLRVDDDAWLESTQKAHENAPALAYAGWLRGPGLDPAWASTDDFWFFRSPFHLALDVGGVTVRFVVHAVDAWTLFPQHDPADDDSAPKLLKLTFMLDPAGPPLDALDDATRARLDAIFRGDLGAPFAFAGFANRHELVVVPTSYPWNLAGTRFTLALRSDPAERSRARVTLRPSTTIAAARVDLAAAKDPARCAQDARLREEAGSALDDVTAARADAERRLALSGALAAGLPAGTGVVDLATIASTTRFTVPITRWLDSLELHVPAVLAAPVVAYSRFLDASRADYDGVTQALAACAHAPAPAAAPREHP